MILRIVFMGTSEFALPSLRALIESDDKIMGVVTQPDRPKGRGHKLHSSPVKELALQWQLPLYQPGDVNSAKFLSTLKKLSPELIIVVAFGQILSKPILDLPKYGCVNLHASLLPKYRGAAPAHWAIINGESETGASTIFMAPRMDAGDIILQRRCPIKVEDTQGSLEAKLAELGARLLLETIDKIKQDQVSPVPQDEQTVSYAPGMKKADCLIDWKKSALQIRDLVRGTNPRPGAYTYHKGKLLKVWGAKVVEEGVGKFKSCGEIVELVKGVGVVVATGKGNLLLTEIQPENRQRINAYEYVKGYRLNLGDVLG